MSLVGCVALAHIKRSTDLRSNVGGLSSWRIGTAPSWGRGRGEDSSEGIPRGLRGFWMKTYPRKLVVGLSFPFGSWPIAGSVLGRVIHISNIRWYSIRICQTNWIGFLSNTKILTSPSPFVFSETMVNDDLIWVKKIHGKPVVNRHGNSQVFVQVHENTYCWWKKSCTSCR